MKSAKVRNMQLSINTYSTFSASRNEIKSQPHLFGIGTGSSQDTLPPHGSICSTMVFSGSPYPAPDVPSMAIERPNEAQGPYWTPPYTHTTPPHHPSHIPSPSLTP